MPEVPTQYPTRDTTPTCDPFPSIAVCQYRHLYDRRLGILTSGGPLQPQPLPTASPLDFNSCNNSTNETLLQRTRRSRGSIQRQWATVLQYRVCKLCQIVQLQVHNLVTTPPLVKWISGEDGGYL